MRKSTMIAVGALTVGLITVPGVAQAANGGAWLLGRSNSESAATTVTNSAGTPLSLKAKAGYAPLAVNSTKVVPSLNADMLDGVHASSFLRTTGKAADSAKVGGLTSASFAMRSGKTGQIVHDGTYDGLGAVCPAGTVFTGGGGYAKFGAAIYYAGPDWNTETLEVIPNSWIVLDDSGVGVSSVSCYSSSGAAVAGAATSIDQLVGDSYAAQHAAGVDASHYPSDAGSAKLNEFKAAQGQAKR